MPEKNLIPQDKKNLAPVETSAVKSLLRSTRGKVGVLFASLPLWKLAYNTIDAWGNLQMVTAYLPRVWQFLGSANGTFIVMFTGFALIAWQLYRQSNRPAVPPKFVQASGTIDNTRETIPENLNAQHQSEKERLEKQIEGLNQEIRKLQSNADALQMSISSRDAELKQYAWLREMADDQARHIDKYVIVERVLLCDINLTDPIQIPYVEFWLDIINTSVYNIRIYGDMIDGRIKFRLNNLLEGKEISYLQESIPPSSRVNINIKQRLNPTEVNLLTPYEKKKEEAAALFNLSNIGVIVSGSTQFPQVQQKRITLPQFVSSNDPTSKMKPDITGKIKGAYSEWWANGELSNSKQMYFDYHFIINVYLVNRGTVTTVEQFKLVLKVGARSYDGKRERDSHDVKEGEMDWRAWGAGELDDLEKFNDVPLEHTRNGWLWFVVTGVPNTEDKSEMELELCTIDKDGTSYKLDPLPQSKWEKNPFLHEARLKEARARMQREF